MVLVEIENIYTAKKNAVLMIKSCCKVPKQVVEMHKLTKGKQEAKVEEKARYFE